MDERENSAFDENVREELRSTRWTSEPWSAFFHRLHRVLHEVGGHPQSIHQFGALWRRIHDSLHDLGYTSGHDDALVTDDRLKESAVEVVDLAQAQKHTRDEVQNAVHGLLQTIANEKHSMSWPAAWLLTRFWPRLAQVIRGRDDPGPDAVACLVCDGTGLAPIHNDEYQVVATEPCRACGCTGLADGNGDS